MEYFPLLNLDQAHLQVTFSVFGVLCLVFIVVCVILIKKKFNSLMVLAFAMILLIPSCCLVDATLGKVAFSKLHKGQNKHMPAPAKCLEYEPEFAALKAKYKVSPEVLKKWAAKYKLKENPSNTFKSKKANKVQNIEAVYDPKTQILTIKYSSF